MTAHRLPLDITQMLADHFATLVDPGDAGEINPDDSVAIVELETGGAETRTVAAPAGLPIGSLLLLLMKTDGGDATVTFATDINATGNTVATFSDTGDWVLAFVGYDIGTSTKAWQVIASDGASLS